MQNTDKTWGQQVIATALQYANHEWIATEENVLHDFDPDDVPVDTPDVTWKGEVLNCGWRKVSLPGMSRRTSPAGEVSTASVWIAPDF